MFCFFGEYTHSKVDVTETLAELSLLISHNPHTSNPLSAPFLVRTSLSLDQLFKKHPDILLLGRIVQPAHKQTLLGVGVTRQPSVPLAQGSGRAGEPDRRR